MPYCVDFFRVWRERFDCRRFFDSNQDRKEYPILLLFSGRSYPVSFIAGLVVLPKLSWREGRNQWLPDADRDFKWCRHGIRSKTQRIASTRDPCMRRLITTMVALENLILGQENRLNSKWLGTVEAPDLSIEWRPGTGLWRRGDSERATAAYQRYSQYGATCQSQFFRPC